MNLGKYQDGLTESEHLSRFKCAPAPLSCLVLCLAIRSRSPLSRASAGPWR